jgi:NADH:ubiquinone oxidoreductase subunit K
MLLTALLFVFVILSSLSFAAFMTRQRGIYWTISLGLLLAAVLIGLNSLILNLLKLSLSQLNYTIVFAVESLLGVALLLWSRSYQAGGPIPAGQVSERVKYGAWTLSVFVAFVLLIPVLVSGHNVQSYTEFYFQESRLVDSTWRQDYLFTDSIPLSLVVVNHETGATAYHVRVVENDVVISDSDLGASDPGGILTYSLVLPPSLQNATKYEFLLFKSDSSEPYRVLYLWIERTE